MEFSKADLAQLEAFLSVSPDAARETKERVGAFLKAARGFKGIPIPKGFMLQLAPLAMLALKTGSSITAAIDSEALAQAADAASSPRTAELFRSLKGL